jgi:hypothetical protein
VTEEPTTGHVDLDTLSDLEEGLAGTQVEVAARTHLDSCHECRERLSRLRTTRALLTALPAEQMPEQVREQVDAALARAAESPSRTVVPLARRARAWNSPAVAGAAAAAAVVVLVGALVAGNVIHRGSSSSTTNAPSAASAGGNAAAPVQTKEWSTGANYSAANIPTLVPRLVQGTPPALSGTTASPTDGLSASSGKQAVASPRSGFTQDELRASPAALQACATALADGVPTTPVAVDFASFAGKPAVILVLPTPSHPALLDVWVVRSTCSASSLDIYFQRVARAHS